MAIQIKHGIWVAQGGTVKIGVTNGQLSFIFTKTLPAGKQASAEPDEELVG